MLPAGLSPHRLPHAPLLPDGFPHRHEPLNTQRDRLPQPLQTESIILQQSSYQESLQFPPQPSWELNWLNKYFYWLLSQA